MIGGFTGYGSVLAIAGVTYALRLGGLLLGRRLPASGPLAEAMDRLPGFVLVSLVAPAILDLGWLGLAGALVAGGAWHIAGRSLLAAIVAGAAVVALGRLL